MRAHLTALVTRGSVTEKIIDLDISQPKDSPWIYGMPATSREVLMTLGIRHVGHRTYTLVGKGDARILTACDGTKVLTVIVTPIKED